MLHNFIIVSHRSIIVILAIVSEPAIRIGFSLFEFELDSGRQGIQCILRSTSVKQFKPFCEPVACGHLYQPVLNLFRNSHGGNGFPCFRSPRCLLLALSSAPMYTMRR